MEHCLDLLVDTRTAWALELYDNVDTIEDDTITDDKMPDYLQKV